MNDIKNVKSIMNFSDNFHMCDVSDVSDEGIHLQSWDEDVSNDEFEQIATLIAADDFDITGFELLEIPHPKVFCFGNLTTKQFFDVVKIWNDKWQFSYIEESMNKFAESIKEAVNKWDND